MLEHTFITTADAAVALSGARKLLSELGFKERPCSGDAVEFYRGKASSRRAARADELPQNIRLEYDRGRISFAASIQCHRKPQPLHRSMLLSLAETAEAHLSKNRPMSEARAPWDAVAREIEANVARRRRFQLICVAVVLIALGVGVLAIILAAAS